jgi:hypothetical protein
MVRSWSLGDVVWPRDEISRMTSESHHNRFVWNLPAS